MSFITRSPSIKTPFHSRQCHQNHNIKDLQMPRDLKISLLTSKLFKGEVLDQQYIKDTINERIQQLPKKYTALPATISNLDDLDIGKIEEAILRARNVNYSNK